MGRLNKSLWCKISLLVMTLLLSFFFSIFLYSYYENILFDKLSTVVGVVAEDSKELEILAMNQLKSSSSQYSIIGKDTLNKYGYSNGRFIFVKDGKNIFLLSIIFSICITILCGICMGILSRNKRRNANRLREYLENINKGKYSLNINVDKDFAIVSDELYKTVVTLRELKENAVKDKMSLKDNIADISHQLKTPITSINIMSQLMDDSSSKNENQEYIHRLNKQIQRLEVLTDSLLTMSKLDTDTIKFTKETIKLKDIIDQGIEPIVSLIEKKNITINISDDKSSIEGDIGWLGEGFLNIIKNSVEHMKYNGKIDILISSNPIFKQIIIEDDGIGFLKEDIPYIFNRFYRGRNAKKDSIGIGLAMSKLIFTKHSGEISVENKKDGGARFRIKFYS